MITKWPSSIRCKKTEKLNFIVRLRQIYFFKKNLVICFKIALFGLLSLKSHAVSLISETSEENLVNVYKILSIEILEFLPFTSNIKMAIFSRISYNLENPNLYLHHNFSKFFSSSDSSHSTESIGRNKRSTYSERINSNISNCYAELPILIKMSLPNKNTDYWRILKKKILN